MKLVIGMAAMLAILGAGFLSLTVAHKREVVGLRYQLEQANARAATEAKAAYARGFAEGRAIAEQAAAAAEKAAAGQIAQLRAQVLSLIEKPRGPEIFDGRDPRQRERDVQILHERALAFERDGNGAAAVKTYIQAARAGSGKAALRLGEIYDKGIQGVVRDYAESLKWYNAARALGEDVPVRRTDDRR